MLAEELSKDAMFLAAEHFESFFDNDKVTRALQLFHNGLVYSINVYGEHEISATVQDRHPYSTIFSLDNPDESLCDCEKPAPCEHIWAAFFATYASMAPVGDLLRDWQKKWQSKKLRKQEIHSVEQKVAAETSQSGGSNKKQPIRHQLPKQKKKKQTNQRNSNKKVEAAVAKDLDDRLATKLDEILALRSKNQSETAPTQKQRNVHMNSELKHTKKSEVAASKQDSKGAKNRAGLSIQSKQTKSDPTVSAWRKHFDLRYSQFLDRYPRTQKGYLRRWPFQKYLSMLEQDQPDTDNALNAFYLLHANLDTLFRIYSYRRAYLVDDYANFMLRSQMMEITDQIHMMVGILGKLDKTNIEPLIAESLSRFHRLLILGSWQLDERLSIFRSLGRLVAHKEEWINQSVHDIKYELDQLAGGAKERAQKVAFTTALIHFYYLKKDDDKAFQLLEDSNLPFRNEAMACVEELLEHEEWDRLLEWLKFETNQLAALLDTKGLNKQMYTDIAGSLLSCFRAYANEKNANEIYEWALDILLPFVPWEYENHLLELGHYKKWVEIYITRRWNPEFIDRDNLKKVQNAAPEALLPLYHQAVVQRIDEKNRESYKQAVKYIRKLRTLYNKMKQKERWQTYVNRLADQYKSRRAFLDELRRVKFIS